MFTIIISLLAVPNIARAGVWYDGGYEFGGIIVLHDCPVAERSPAVEYDNDGGEIGGAQLVDKGDRVEVRFADGTNYYFKSKAACERFGSRIRRANEREKERLDRYR